MPEGFHTCVVIKEDAIGIVSRTPHAVVAYPTDTVMGLGCSVYDGTAVQRLLDVKERPASKKGLPVLVSEIGAARRIAKMGGAAERLASRFWPGALTLVLPVLDTEISELVTSEGTVGIRVPDSDIARRVASAFGGVVVGTSANRSGHAPVLSAEEAVNTLRGIDFAVESDAAMNGLSSTIFDVEKEEVLREGAIPAALIREVLLG
jgi:L-threonylcarbamoyladenylate synthase